MSTTTNEKGSFETASNFSEDLTQISATSNTATVVVDNVKSHDSISPTSHTYQIKPNLEDRFKELPVKEIIRNVQTEILTGKLYDGDNVKKWTTQIANEVSNRVIELHMRRYKHVVQVVLGEYKGAGVKSGVRCLWDSETDGYTSDTFINDTIFCLTAVYAIYLY